MVDDITRGATIAVKYVLLLVICVGFLGIGMLTIVGHPGIIAQFDYWSYPRWSMYLVGLVEVILSIVVFYHPAREKGLIGVILLMCGAGLTHLMFKQISYSFVPLIMIMICVCILYIERLELKWKAQQ
jgi:hypothetical protein